MALIHRATSGPAVAAPGVDPHRELGRPEPEGRERHEELVPPVSSRWSSRASRRICAEAGEPLGLERRSEPSQERRLERLALQPREQLREQDQVVRPPVDVGQDRSDLPRDGQT